MSRQYKKYLATLLTKYFHPIDNLTSLNHSYLTDYQIDIVFKKTAKERKQFRNSKHKRSRTNGTGDNYIITFSRFIALTLG